MTLRRAVCAILGHVAGLEVFRYARVSLEASQWPNRRGQTQIERIGCECVRCRRLILTAPAGLKPVARPQLSTAQTVAPAVSVSVSERHER